MVWAGVMAVALLVLGVGLGWPWGPVAVIGCILLPFVVMRLLLRFTVMVHRGHPGPSDSQVLYVRSIRLRPEDIETVHQAIPGQAGAAITERN